MLQPKGYVAPQLPFRVLTHAHKAIPFPHHESMWLFSRVYILYIVIILKSLSLKREYVIILTTSKYQAVRPFFFFQHTLFFFFLTIFTKVFSAICVSTRHKDFSLLPEISSPGIPVHTLAFWQTTQLPSAAGLLFF